MTNLNASSDATAKPCLPLVKIDRDRLERLLTKIIDVEDFVLARTKTLAALLAKCGGSPPTGDIERAAEAIRALRTLREVHDNLRTDIDFQELPSFLTDAYPELDPEKAAEAKLARRDGCRSGLTTVIIDIGGGEHTLYAEPAVVEVLRAARNIRFTK